VVSGKGQRAAGRTALCCFFVRDGALKKSHFSWKKVLYITTVRGYDIDVRYYKNHNIEKFNKLEKKDKIC
jgi:hypothetical protein